VTTQEEVKAQQIKAIAENPNCDCGQPAKYFKREAICTGVTTDKDQPGVYFAVYKPGPWSGYCDAHKPEKKKENLFRTPPLAKVRFLNGTQAVIKLDDAELSEKHGMCQILEREE